jgi:hypothetical protein
MTQPLESLLTPEKIAVIDPLTERSTGILHPERYWYWDLLKQLAKRRLLIIVPDKARGDKLIRISWTAAGREEIERIKGAST